MTENGKKISVMHIFDSVYLKVEVFFFLFKCFALKEKICTQSYNSVHRGLKSLLLSSITVLPQELRREDDTVG